MNTHVIKSILSGVLCAVALTALAQHGSSRGGGGGGGGHSGGFSGGHGSSGGFGGGHSSFGGYSGGQRSYGGSSGSRGSYGSYSGGQRSYGGSSGSRGSYGGYSGGRGSFGGYSGSRGTYGGSAGSRGSKGGGYSTRSYGSNGSSSRYGESSRYSHSFGSERSSGSRYGGSRSGGSGTSSFGSRGPTSSDPAFGRGHAGSSRSGGVHYSGSNNLNGSFHGSLGGERVGRAPSGRLGPSLFGGRGGRGPGGLGGRLFGEHAGMFRDGYRCGYYGYWGGWSDSFFCFPFYCFDPFASVCYCSPWYYYPCLPAYVAAPNVIVETSYPSANWSGNDYNWSPDSQGGGNPVLDDSVRDIVEAFQHDDHMAINRLVPHDGNVQIFTDGKYSYSLKSNDFYDTYVDGIEGTKTTQYEILDVRANGDGTARVVAKHEYTDPWGKRAFVYHRYFLKREGDTYVIREFGTSNYAAGS